MDASNPNGSEKSEWLAELRGQLTGELEAVRARALDAAQAATHEENKPEGDKDMRSTEASYIAHGQARQAGELESALARLATLEPRSFGEGSAVQAAAVVAVECDGRAQRFWILPVAGGRTVTTSAGALKTLATASPLGAALLGLRAGDEAEVTTPQGVKSYVVVAVT